jgi:hypothetical protein
MAPEVSRSVPMQFRDKIPTSWSQLLYKWNVMKYFKSGGLTQIVTTFGYFLFMVRVLIKRRSHRQTYFVTT